MTVIQSASRYAYASAYRARQSTGEDVNGFSPSLTEQTDPDGGHAGNSVRPQMTRKVDDTTDTRFEFSLPYKSAFFHASGKDGRGNAARDNGRDDRSATVEADDTVTTLPAEDIVLPAASAADPVTEAADDDIPENPVDMLTSLLGG